MQIRIPVDNSIDSNIHMTAENALTRRPAMANVIKPFTDLFVQKSLCMAHLGNHILPMDMSSAHDRLLSGIPVLTTLSLTPWRESLETAFEWMLPAIGQTFSVIGTDISAIASSSRNGSLRLVLLAEEYLDGSFKHYESAAQSIGISSDTLGFIMRTVLSTVLASIAPKIGEYVVHSSWSKGYCPICGTLPSVSFLTGPAEPAEEFLVNTGGRKFLHCGLCGHDWPFNRHICPVCDNVDKDLQLYLMVPDQPGERVDMCRKCGLYLPCVDLREQHTMPHLDTAAVCMIHLDILAQQKGFKPLSKLPWNCI